MDKAAVTLSHVITKVGSQDARPSGQVVPAPAQASPAQCELRQLVAVEVVHPQPCCCCDGCHPLLVLLSPTPNPTNFLVFDVPLAAIGSFSSAATTSAVVVVYVGAADGVCKSRSSCC